MSDLSETLTLALRSGDREAWNLVVRSETARLHGIARAITRDSGLAEDAVQETFLRLVEGRVRRVRGGGARALLASMAARAAIDALRRREARGKREEAHGMARSEEDTAPGPEKAVLDAELARSIDDALALLDPLTRAAVWLHVVEGHGVRDVARTFEMARSTTADRIRAGLGRLEETLRRRGLASVLTLGWAALLGKSAFETASPELVDRLRALGDRLEPGMPAGHRTGTGRSALPRAAGLAGMILVASGIAFLVFHGPETAPTPVAIAPTAQTPVTVASTPPKPLPESPARKAPAERVVSDSVETFRIAGTVYDVETRLPIAGARIRPEKQAPSPPGIRRDATSGADGEFELVLPADADEAFIAEAEGYSPTGDIWVGRGRELEHVYFPLLPLFEVSGRVLGEHGKPLPGATVEVTGVSQGKSTSYPSDRGNLATAGPDGAFTIRLPELGQARLSVLQPGYGGVIHMGVLPGTKDCVVIVPWGVRVSGIVLDGGRPAAGASVRWWTDGPGITNWKGEALADPEGRFALVLPAKTRHILHAEEGDMSGAEPKEALKAGARFVARVEAVRGTDPPEIVLDLGSLRDWKEAKAREKTALPQTAPAPATRESPRKRNPQVNVRGIVVDPRGRPVSHALVRIVFSTPHYRSHADAVTGSDGRFSMSRSQSPGTYSVQLLVTHRAWAEKRLDLGEIAIEEAETVIEALSGLEVALSTGYALTARLSDGSGASLEDALVLAGRPEAPKTMRLLARTDPEGRFRLEHRAVEEEVSLTFSKPGFAKLGLHQGPGLAPDGGAADLGDVILTRGGSVEGFALRADGSPASWSAMALEGPWLVETVRTDGAGWFRFEHVQAGTARIGVLWTDDIHVGHVPMEPPEDVEVVDGVTRRRDIRLRE